jgi:hypothetical protein
MLGLPLAFPCLNYAFPIKALGESQCAVGAAAPGWGTFPARNSSNSPGITSRAAAAAGAYRPYFSV